MEQIKVKLRKWGNSIGVIIPQETLKSVNKKEGEIIEVLIPVQNDNVLKEMFGTFKFKKPVDKIMKEIDKELDGKR